MPFGESPSATSRSDAWKGAPGHVVVSIAATERIRSVLQWVPQLDDLDTIVHHTPGMGASLVRV